MDELIGAFMILGLIIGAVVMVFTIIVGLVCALWTTLVFFGAEFAGAIDALAKINSNLPPELCWGLLGAALAVAIGSLFVFRVYHKRLALISISWFPLVLFLQLRLIGLVG